MIEKIQYQKDLDDGVFPPTQLNSSDVRYWSDFNRVYYHPRSSVQLMEYELDSTLQPFAQFDLGVDLYKQLDREHDLLDRDFRLFAEECDQIQGIQMITSADDGWAGFASKYIEDLHDEFGKVPIVVWGVEGGGRVSRVSSP